MFSDRTQFFHFAVIFHRLSKFLAAFYRHRSTLWVWWQFFSCVQEVEISVSVQPTAEKHDTQFCLPLSFPLKFLCIFFCLAHFFSPFCNKRIGDAVCNNILEKKVFLFAWNNFHFNHWNGANDIRERKIRMDNVTKWTDHDENKFEECNSVQHMYCCGGFQCGKKEILG